MSKTTPTKHAGYKLLISAIRVYLFFTLRCVHIQGKENVPEEPKIVVANHALAVDGFVLPFLFKDELHFFAQGDLFDIPIAGNLLKWGKQIPVIKGKGPEALKEAIGWLKPGHSVGIFPEGRLNSGQSLHRAFTGAARLSLETGAPVVPVGFYTPPQYALALQRQYQGREAQGAWQTGGPIYVKIGHTYRPSPELRHNFDLDTIRRTTEHIMARIQEQIDLITNSLQVKK